jgi:hypothetical protein
VVEEKAGEVRLEARGRFHREAIAASRNHGDEHIGLLADAATLLSQREIEVRIVKQEGGYLRPDAEFEWDGRIYSLEVECSTLATHTAQVVRNVRKALEDERRCLVVVSGQQAAVRAAILIREEIPHSSLWREFGVAWPDSRGELAALPDGRRTPWPFLRDGQAEGPDDEDQTEDEDELGPEEDWEPEYTPGVGNPVEADVALARKIAHELLASGTEVATAGDFLERVPPGPEGSMDAHRLGMALSSLGVGCRRFRRDGERVREYDLRSLRGPGKASQDPADSGGKNRSEPDDKEDHHGFAS